MAGVVGNRGAGYATITPQPNYIGEAIQNVEDNAFKYRAEKRLRDEAEAKKAEDDEKELDLALKQFSPTLTQNQSLNDSITDYASSAKNQYAEAAQLYNTTKDPKYKKQMNNLLQSFSLAKQAPDALNKTVADIQDGIMKDKYSPASVELIKSKLKSLETGKSRIYPDENGIMRIDTFEVDENGKPIGILSKGEDLTAFFKNIQPRTNYDFETDRKQFLANNPLSETEIQRGFTTTTRKQVDDRIRQQAIDKATEIVNNEDKMFQAYYNLTGKPKENFTQADRDLVAAELTDNLIKSYGETYKKDIDQGGILAATKNRQEQQEKRVKRSIVKLDKARTDDFLAAGQDGKVVSPNTIYPNAIGFESGKVKLDNVGGALSGLNGGFVTGVTKDRNTGDFVFTGKAIKDKGQKFKLPSGETVTLEALNALVADPATDSATKNAAQLELDSYSTAANLGNWTRRVENEDEAASILLKAGFESLQDADRILENQNKGIRNAAPKTKKSSTISGGTIR